ncbi:MAG: TonB-dependent receptor [Nitrospinae bacterium]|nr:TonB-dependent receptor [Nitrospinota bacterium]
MFRILKIYTFLFIFGFLLSPAFADEQKYGTEHDGPMEHYAVHLDEVIVSTPMQDTIASSATPVTVLHDDNLRMKAGATIGETLQNELGVHGQAFGPGVGLPVIRGQDGPRVRVLSNGLGANDASQNSPDHASITTPLNAERIEILRGPATLLYGSGAIGGVVNVIDNRIPEKIPETGGSIEHKYNTATTSRQTALQFEGGKSKFAYHFDGYFQESEDLNISGDAVDVTRGQVSQSGLSVDANTNGFVNNTNTHNTSVTGGASFVGDSGFFGVSGNMVHMDYQIPTRGGAGDEASFINMEQRKLDFKGGLNNLHGFFKKIDGKLSFTDYEHNEAHEALFQNDTIEGRVDAKHTPIFGMDGVMGFQMISSYFAAQEAEADEYITPKTRTNSYAVFLQESFNLSSNNVAQFGLRIEHDVLDSQLRANPDQSFTPVSLSVSDLWTIDDKKSINIAITRSQRAPIVNELYFEGDHEATTTFQTGNPNLDLETSYNIDIGYKSSSEKVAWEINLFHNWVNDYIYSARTGGTGGDDNNPAVNYLQSNASFIGYEAQLIYHVMKKGAQDVDLTLFSDYTRGQLTDVAGSVPRIPPLRWGFQLDHRNGNWKSNLRLTRAESQEYSGSYEADTPGYTLLNLNTHYHIENFKKADMVVYAKGNNLLDENIRNAASFLRNFQPEPGIGAEIGIRIDY